MAAFVWPTTLPQKVRVDFSSSDGVKVSRTSMDKGPPKQRFEGLRPETMPVSMFMTTAQLAEFKTFADVTTKGVYPFEFPHPITGETVDVRIVPGDKGNRDISYVGPGNWLVAFSLEVMP